MCENNKQCIDSLLHMTLNRVDFVITEPGRNSVLSRWIVPFAFRGDERAFQRATRLGDGSGSLWGMGRNRCHLSPEALDEGDEALIGAQAGGMIVVLLGCRGVVVMHQRAAEMRLIACPYGT
jgi:hypothetical protein